MGMTKRFWMLLVCLLLVCGVALAECAICGGDSVCDTCDGNGYLLMQAYGSDEQLKVACTGGCNNGRCPDCAPPCDVCGGDQKCDVCGGLGYLIRQAYGSGEDVKVACTGENCADGACAVCVQAAADGAYVFADAAVERNARYQLNKAEGEGVTAEELAGLTELSVMSPETLSDLLMMPNLKKLRVFKGKISDFSPIAALTQLQELELQKTYKLQDLSVLSSLTGLKKLELDENNLPDLSPLASLKGLECLACHNSNISDLTGLSALTNLKELRLTDNNIEDISELEPLTQLQNLQLYWNDISDISALAGMTQLKKLGLEGNEIQRIDALAGMTQMEELTLQNNQIYDISPLAGMTKLKILHINNNYLREISAIKPLVSLEKLFIEHNAIRDFSVLDEMPIEDRWTYKMNQDAQIPDDIREIAPTPKPTFRTGLTMVSDNNGGFKFINVTATPAPTLPEEPTIDLMAILAESQAEREKENTISFEVWLMMDDTLWPYEVETTEPVLLDALLDENLIGGEYVSWGFNVTRVDDIEAKGNEYWTIEEYNFARGEFESMQDSITTHRVQDGDRYGFRLIR